MVKDTRKLDTVRKYHGVDVGGRHLVYMCICMYILVLHAKKHGVPKKLPSFLGGLVSSLMVSTDPTRTTWVVWCCKGPGGSNDCVLHRF